MSWRWTALPLCLAGFNLGACEPYRIEYRERPSFYKQTSETELLDAVVLEDGTVLRFSDSKNTPPPIPSSQQRETNSTRSAKPISIRTATESGELLLTSYSPEHVLSHIKRGIRLREYQLLWDHVLSNATREAYARDGGDFEDFAVFCDENRSELMQFLNRVGFGIYSSDVVKESFGSSGIRIRLHPSLSSQFKFTQLEIVRESNQLRWLMIR